MAREDNLRLEAKVVEARPNATFVCELENGRFKPLTDWLAP